MVLFIAASLTHSETLEKLRKVTESYGKLRKVMKIQNKKNQALEKVCVES